MRFQVMTEFPHLRSRDTYDVTDCDSGDHIVQSVTHAEATFIAAVLNREVTADDLRIEALFIAAMLNERNEASIKAEALREAADDLEAVADELVRQAKAEAWDEGYDMSDLGWNHVYDGHDCAEGEMCPTCCQPNPYRIEARDE